MQRVGEREATCEPKIDQDDAIPVIEEHILQLQIEMSYTMCVAVGNGVAELNKQQPHVSFEQWGRTARHGLKERLSWQQLICDQVDGVVRIQRRVHPVPPGDYVVSLRQHPGDGRHKSPYAGICGAYSSIGAEAHNVWVWRKLFGEHFALVSSGQRDVRLRGNHQLDSHDIRACGGT